MMTGKWRRLFLVTVSLSVASAVGCSGFWDAPKTSSSFTLSNSGNISVAPGATTGNTSSISITPASSFTGTVALTCSVTSSPSGATSPATCSLSPASVSISSAAAQTSTLTATTTSSTTTGTYNISVTGTSGSASQTTTLCAEVSTSSGSCTASTGGGSGRFYVLNQNTKQIVGYSIASGSLTGISGSPYTLSADPLSIAIAPSGNFLYVGTAAGIFLYAIQSNGQLTLANNLNAISQDVATTMQVDPSGQWLLEAGPNLKELLALRINTSTGVPLSSTEQFTLLPAATVQQLTVSPDNAHVFVALGSSGTQDVTFASNQTNPFGSTVNIPTLNSAGSALSVAVDPTNRLLYIGETVAISAPTNTGGLRVINYNTLVEISGSPFATGGLSSVEIVPLPLGPNKGNYVYVVNRTISGSSNGSIQGFVIAASGNSYSVTSAGDAASTGVAPVGLVEENKGNYMLVVNAGGAPDLQAFTFDSANPGKLNSALTAATGTDPVLASGIAAAP